MRFWSATSTCLATLALIAFANADLNASPLGEWAKYFPQPRNDVRGVLIEKPGDRDQLAGLGTSVPQLMYAPGAQYKDTPCRLPGGLNIGQFSFTGTPEQLEAFLAANQTLKFETCKLLLGEDEFTPQLARTLLLRSMMYLFLGCDVIESSLVVALAESGRLEGLELNARNVRGFLRATRHGSSSLRVLRLARHLSGDPRVMSFIESLPLRALNINAREVSGDDLRKLAQLSNLEYLGLQEGSISLTPVLADVVRSLKKLQVLRLTSIVVPLGEVLGACPSLRTLELSACRVLEADADVVSKSELHAVSTDFADGSAALWSALSQLPKLRSLSVAVCKLGDAETFSELLSGCKLTTLKLDSVVGLEQRHLDAIAKQEALECLEVSGCDSLSDEFLKAVSGMKRLRSLNITQSGRFSAAGLLRIAEMAELETLEMVNVPLVGDVVVTAIAASCKRSKHLNVSGCRLVTTKGALEVLKNESVMFFEASSCPSIDHHTVLDKRARDRPEMLIYLGMRR